MESEFTNWPPSICQVLKVYEFAMIRGGSVGPGLVLGFINCYNIITHFRHVATTSWMCKHIKWYKRLWTKFFRWRRKRKTAFRQHISYEFCWAYNNSDINRRRGKVFYTEVWILRNLIVSHLSKEYRKFLLFCRLKRQKYQVLLPINKRSTLEMYNTAK